MEIKFEKDDSITYAISQDCIYEGYLYEEIIWAEIKHGHEGNYSVRFETAWDQPVYFSTEGEAKTFVLRNYSQYKPQPNGPRYPVKS
jgi:hypothetical protein